MYTKKLKLSGVTNGRNIKLTGTTTGTSDLIHTSVTGSDDIDEIYIYALNSDSSTRTVTIEFGGVASPDDLITMDLDAGKGAYLIIPGWLLQNGLVVNGFASVADVVIVNGFVHRIFQV